MSLQGFWGFNDTQGAADPAFTIGGAVYTTTQQRGTGGALTLSTTATTFALSSGQTTVIVGGAFRATSAYATLDMIRFQEGATIHCRVTADSSGHLIIKGPANTTLATSTFTMPLDTYTDGLEVKAVIHDTTGSVEVKVAGVGVVVSYSGDTRNGGTGVVDTVAMLRGANTMYLDDFYICDGSGSSFNDYLGDVAVRTLLPTGNGASSQWTGSDGNSTDNYLLVDETNANTSDYVAASAASLTDLYALTDIPTTDLPLAWRTMAHAAKNDAGTPPTMKPVTRGDAGTVLEESAIVLSTSYQRFAGAQRFTDPEGNTLTAARINAMQGGWRSS